MPTYNLLLNSKNAIQNNVFQYRFPSGAFKIPEGSEMCISQITIPNSWPNVSTALGNNLIQYSFYNGTGTTTTTVTLPEGNYTVSDIDAAIKKSLYTNNYYFYLQNQGTASMSSIIYPISLVTTASLYANAFQLQFIPPINSNAVAVAASSIANYTLTFGTTQILNAGVQYFISGANIPDGTYIVGTGVTSTTYKVNTLLTVASTSISYFQNFVWSTVGIGYTWAGGLTSQSATAAGVNNTAVGYLPNITIPQIGGLNISATTQGLGNIIGFTNGIYPPTQQTLTFPASFANSQPVSIYSNSLRTYTYTIASNSSFTVLQASPTFAPKGSFVNGIIIRCDMIDNKIAAITDVIDTAPVNSAYGSNIVYLPLSDNTIRIKPGTYQSFNITFNDDNYGRLNILDTNVLITLIIKIP